MDNESHHHMFKTIMCKLVAATIPGHLSVIVDHGIRDENGFKFIIDNEIEKLLDEWLSLNDVQCRIPV